MKPADIDTFRKALLGWFAVHHRRMPIRETRDPWAVWVSEIILQQTTVSSGLPYWERFMLRFPTVEALADAPLQDVLHAWAGLGYYSRARNLHKAAAMVAANGGGIPDTMDGLLALPGIGRYTAGAILSFAFGKDAAVVDANIARVLARLESVEGDPKSSKVQRLLHTTAERLLPHGEARDWNLALMDLGAGICTPVQPSCSECPVSAFCVAFHQDRQAELGISPPRPPMTEQTDVAIVLTDDTGRIALVRRPNEGVWGGLWEVPRVTMNEDETPEQAAVRAGIERLEVQIAPGPVVATIRHTVMRRRITLRSFEAQLTGEGFEETEDRRWVTPESARGYPLSSPQRRLMETLRTSDLQV